MLHKPDISCVIDNENNRPLTPRPVSPYLPIMKQIILVVVGARMGKTV